MMFRALSLLLLILILYVQLYSSAPIPAEDVPLPYVVEEPGLEEHTLVEKRESVEEKRIPDDAAEAAPHPEEPPAEEVIPVTGKDPASQQPAAKNALTIISVQVAAKPDENAEADLINREPPEQDEEEEEAPDAQDPLILAGDPEEKASEDVAEETMPLEAAQEVLVTVRRDSAEPESDPEEQEAKVLISSSETEERAPEDHEREALVPVAPEENPATDEESLPSIPEEEETHIPVPAEPETEEEDEAGPAADERTPDDLGHEDIVSVLLDSPEEESEPEGQEIDPVNSSDTEKGVEEEDDKLVPIISKEEDSLASIPAESETELNQAGPAEGETPGESSSENSAIIALVESAAQEPGADEQAEEVPVSSSQRKEEEPEESVIIVLPEPDMEEEDEMETGADETTLQDLAQEDVAANVPVDSGQESEPEDREIVLVGPSDAEQGAPEEHAEEEAFTSKVPEEDPASNEESLLSTIEEDFVIVVPAQPETEVEDPIGPAAEEDTPEDSTQEDLVIVHVDSELEEREKMISVSSSETKEDAPVEQRDEEEESLALLPAEPETEEMAETGPAAEETDPGDPAVTVPASSDEQESTETLPGTQEEADPPFLVPKDETEGESEEETALEPIPEEPAVIVLMAPTHGEPSTRDPNLKVPPDGAEKNTEEEEEAVQSYPTDAVSEEDLDEEPTAAPVGAIRAEADRIPAAVKDGSRTKESRASLLPVHDEPMARVNRGALLGAALFTLMSFIIVGFIGLTISKKLR